jgi:hypothetical protein
MSPKRGYPAAGTFRGSLTSKLVRLPLKKTLFPKGEAPNKKTFRGSLSSLLERLPLKKGVQRTLPLGDFPNPLAYVMARGLGKKGYNTKGLI